MKKKAILFDVNGTLSEIWTDEGDDNVFRILSNFMNYQGVKIQPSDLKSLYFEINEAQRKNGEHHPEFDAIKLFKEIMKDHKTKFTSTLPKEKIDLMPQLFAEIFRASSLKILRLYPNVKTVLDTLKKDYKLAVVSDGQEAWARQELNFVGLNDYFNPVIISSKYGYRKPDPRLFKKALDELGIEPFEAIYVGNDKFHDILGANQIGMTSVWFKSNQGDQTYKATPDYTMTNWSELPEIISKIEKD
ncbi:MAG: HAD family hydrolase [Alphaproteobacteria bacterium]|nr:HAD family hydrolase [Alphaproteobacteria bacterium]